MVSASSEVPVEANHEENDMNIRKTLAGLGAAGVVLGAGLADGALDAAAAPAATPTIVGEHQIAAAGTTATLYISYAGYGYYNVVVDGHSSAANATVGVRVKGDDEWFDDSLFSFGGGYSHTDPWGNFNVATMVPGGKLNEDWGQDEIYAIVEVSGGGSVRTNTITGYF
jgi:hypothetical protein